MKKVLIALATGFLLVAAFFAAQIRSPRAKPDPHALAPATHNPPAVSPADSPSGNGNPSGGLSQASSSPAVRTPIPRTSVTIAATVEFGNWARRWIAGDRSIDASRGEAMAWKRRQEMLRWIETDPSRALAEAVPFAWRQALPPNVTRHFEQWVDGRGDLIVAMAERQQAPDKVYRWINIRGEHFEAFAAESPLVQHSRSNIPLHGIALGRKIALTKHCIRIISEAEADAITPLRDSSLLEKCAVCGEPANETGVIGEIGGETRWFCCTDHAELAESSLVLAADGGAGAAFAAGISTAWTQGRKDVLYIRVNFPDDLTEPNSEAEAYNTMDTVNQYYVNASYNQVWLSTTVTPLLTVPQIKAWYSTAGPGELFTDAREAARKAGYETGNYELDIVSHTTVPGFDWGGLGAVGGKGTWLQSHGAGVTAHELGHNLGLLHANFWLPFAPYTSAYGRGTNIEYGNIFDTMGSAGAGNTHFSAYFKHKLDWLPDTAVHFIHTNGVYRLHPFDASWRQNDRMYAASVRKDFDRDYWIEFRNRLTGNPSLQNGVLLNWDAWMESGGQELIDTTPATATLADAAIVVGRTYSDVQAGVHITPLARGMAGTDPWIDVQVNLDTNVYKIPCCLNVEMQPAIASAGQPVLFHATVPVQADGLFAYFWSFDDGTFSTNNQPWISKSWTTSGEHVVRCVVSDMRGGRASANVIATVGSATGFRLSGIVLDEEGIGVQDALVICTNQDESFFGFTDSDGAFVLAGLNGYYDISAEKYGYGLQPMGWNTPLQISSNFTGANFLARQMTHVTLTITTNVVAENDAAINQFILTRSGDGSNDLTVELYLSGTATPGSDYTLTPPLEAGINSVVFPEGTNQLEFSIVPVNNGTVEPTEEVYLTIRDSDAYVINHFSEAHLTILDDDQPGLPGISITSLDGPVVESGLNAAGFLVTRNGSTSGSLPVFYTVGGTATAGTDYNTLVGTVVIPAGSSSAVIELTVLDDKDVEPKETVSVTLSPSATYTISTASATETILDDDVLVVTVSPTQSGLAEPSSSGRFTIKRDGDQSVNLVVNYTMAGSASNGVDYATPSGSVTIPAGTASADVVIDALNDALLEGDETVELVIATNAAYDVGLPASATLILRDDELPTVTAESVDEDASEPGSDFGVIEISRGGVTSGDLTVQIAISGTAIPGADYLPVSSPVVIPNGSSSVTLTIIPFDDLHWEPTPETVMIRLIAGTNYNAGLPEQATVNIADDEFSNTPAVGFTSETVSVLESESPGLAVGLSHTSTAPVTVEFQVTGGTATMDSDYTLAPGILAFEPGEWAKSIPLPINDDSNPEADETIRVTLFNPSGATHDGIKTITYTIIDDDMAAVSVSATAATASEVGPVAGNFRITRTGGTNNSITVHYQVTGTASSPSDFPTLGNSVTLPAGVTYADLPVIPVADATVELDEEVKLTLTSAPGGRIVSPHAATITIFDADTNGLPVVSMTSSNQPYAVEGGGNGAFVLTRSGPTNNALTVTLTITGSASSPGDYAPLPTTVIIPAGEFSVILPVSAADDSAVEGDESVVATVTAVETYRVAFPGGAQVTIQDNDQSVRVDASDFEAAEPGSNCAEFTFTRFGSTNDAVEVFYTITGTAGNGVDYELIPNSVVVPAGSLTNVVVITPLDDLLVEIPETVTLTLQANAGYTLGSATVATASILDDEPMVRIIASQGDVQEGSRSPVVLSLQRGGDLSHEFTARLAVSGSATYGADYPAFQTNVFFNCGIATIDLPLSPTNELAIEDTETVSITILPDAAYTRLAPSNAVVSILDSGTNLAPVVTISSPTTNLVYLLQTNANMILEATITDDGDTNMPLTVTWTNLSGPEPVFFGDITFTNTTVTFSNSGVYVLRLTADDGQLAGHDDVTVVVGALARLTNNSAGTELIHWTFDEGGGDTVEDSSGNGRSGAVQGPPSWTTGISSNAISLSGSSNFVQTTNNADFLNGLQCFTLTCWVNPAEVPSTQGLVAGEEGPTNSTLTLATRTTASCGTATNVYEATLTTLCGESELVSTPNLVTNAWQHIALTWSNGLAPSLYINGELDQPDKHALPAKGELMNCPQFVLGKGPMDISNTWAGFVDELRVFSWPMDAAEAGTFVAANFGPIVQASTNVTVPVLTAVDLGGDVMDDGQPVPPGALTVTWSQVDGPYTVIISDPNALTNSVSFDFAGDYLFRLIADDGQVKIYEDLPVTVVEAAQIFLYASDSEAAELGPDTGEFYFLRFGDLDTELTVDYTLSGTASNVADFVEILQPHSITFPTGTDTVAITIIPFLDHRTEGDETVTLTVESNLLYTILSGEATVTIHDSPYGQWTVDNFTLEQLTDPTLSGEAADFDHDGFNNFVEYSGSRDPKSAETNALLTTAIELDPGDGLDHVTLTYTRRLPPTDTAYEVAVSTNLISWQTGTNHVRELFATDDGNLLTEKVKAQLVDPWPSSSPLFVTVRVWLLSTGP